MIVNLNMISICLIIILMVGEGQSLQCWSCSSVNEPGCDDSFTPNDLTGEIEYFLHDCDGDTIMNGSLEEQHLMEHLFGPDAKEYCRKTVREVYGITLVHRGCSFGDVSKDCTDDHDACQACFEDGCNVATKLGRISVLFPPIIMFLYSY